MCDMMNNKKIFNMHFLKNIKYFDFLKFTNNINFILYYDILILIIQKYFENI